LQLISSARKPRSNKLLKGPELVWVRVSRLTFLRTLISSAAASITHRIGAVFLIYVAPAADGITTSPSEAAEPALISDKSEAKRFATVVCASHEDRHLNLLAGSPAIDLASGFESGVCYIAKPTISETRLFIGGPLHDER
jgi:hypothetical protein